MFKERELKVASGFGPLFGLLLLIVVSGLAIIFLPVLIKIVAGILLIVWVFLLGGLFFVNPNEARVLQLFGKYIGTAKKAGLRWANPFYSKHRLSLPI